jgi:hypothetical protein
MAPASPHPATVDAEPNRIRMIPKDPAHQPLYEMIKEHRILEKLQTIFSPFISD